MSRRDECAAGVDNEDDHEGEEDDQDAGEERMAENVEDLLK